MRRFLVILIFLSLFLGVLVGCNTPTNGPDSGNEIVENDSEQRRIYNLAVETGYKGTYEQWLNSIKGDSVVLQVSNGYIQWKYTNDTSWKNLIALAELAGAPGIDGKTPELRVDGEYIQWKYGSDSEWKNLLELESISGLTPEFKVNDTHILWKYTIESDSEWRELFSKDELVGTPGEDGTSIHTGNGEPLSLLGKDGDSYINLSTWDYYVKDSEVWSKVGNIKLDSKEHDGTDGLEFYPISDTECAVSIGRALFAKDIVIPSMYKNYTVTSVLGMALLQNVSVVSSIETVKIPATVKTIDDKAFCNLSSLKSIEFEENCQLEIIGDYAFYNCSNLTSITIPSTLTEIGELAFDNTNLSTIYYNGSEEELNSINIEEGNEKLYNVVIYDSKKEEICLHKNEYFGGYDATCEDYGLTDAYGCVKCGNIISASELIPPGHNYGNYVTDDLYHWYECSCGDKSELGPHTWNDGIVIEQATESKLGKIGYECEVCGKQKIVEVDINGHSHSFGSEWKKDASSHWNECGCGEKANSANHEFGAWVVEGEIEKRSCSVCGQEETREITQTWDGTTVSESLTGAGTLEDPYLINNGADLAYVRDNAASLAGKFVKLMTNVDMNESNFMITTFGGTFDGNGYTVSGLKLESASFEVPTGLFCDLEATGTIKNLSVRGSATTEWTTAGIVGRSAGTIDNCKNYVAITSKWDVGGVVALATAGSITNCENHATVSGKTNTGGIVGWAKDNVSVSNCKNYGNIHAADSAGAGVVGCVANNVTVSYCENYGEITGKEGLAGIVGGRQNACNVNVTIQHCVNEGKVYGGNFASGIASVFNWDCNGILIDSCINKGSVESNDWCAGGIVGLMHSGEGQSAVVSNCVNEGNVYALNGEAAGIVGCLYGFASADSCTNKGVITAGEGKSANGICATDENDPSTTNCQDLSAAE